MCILKGAYIRESSFTWNVELPSQYRYKPCWLGSNSFALHRQSTNVDVLRTCEQRGPRTEKTEPDLVSLAFRDQLVVLPFIRCFFAANRTCEKTDILRTVQRRVKYREREHRRKVFRKKHFRDCKAERIYFLLFFADKTLRDAIHFLIFL